MSNMSYCQFENTSEDLDQCYETMIEWDSAEDGLDSLNRYERVGLARMLNTCRNILHLTDEILEIDENEL